MPSCRRRAACSTLNSFPPFFYISAFFKIFYSWISEYCSFNFACRLNKVENLLRHVTYMLELSSVNYLPKAVSLCIVAVFFFFYIMNYP